MVFIFILTEDLLIDFRERGREEEREIDHLPLVCAPTGDQTHNLGMCPDLELKL